MTNNFEKDINVPSKEIITGENLCDDCKFECGYYDCFDESGDESYVWEQDHDTYTIEECQETLKEYCHSTIYQGFRYFFTDLESLKKFCEMAEKRIL